MSSGVLSVFALSFSFQPDCYPARHVNEAHGGVLCEFSCERGVLAVEGNDRGGASGNLAADPKAIRAQSSALFFAPLGCPLGSDIRLCRRGCLAADLSSDEVRSP